MPRATQLEPRPSNFGRISAPDPARSILLSQALPTCRPTATPTPTSLSRPTQGSRPASVEPPTCCGPQLLLGYLHHTAPRSPERSEVPGAETPGSPPFPPAPRGPASPPRSRRPGPLAAWPPKPLRLHLPGRQPGRRFAAGCHGDVDQTRSPGAWGWGDRPTRGRRGQARPCGGSPATETTHSSATSRSRSFKPGGSLDEGFPETTFRVLSFLRLSLPSPVSSIQRGSKKYLLNEGRTEIMKEQSVSSGEWGWNLHPSSLNPLGPPPPHPHLK